MDDLEQLEKDNEINGENLSEIYNHVVNDLGIKWYNDKWNITIEESSGNKILVYFFDGENNMLDEYQIIGVADGVGFHKFFEVKSTKEKTIKNIINHIDKLFPNEYINYKRNRILKDTLNDPDPKPLT